MTSGKHSVAGLGDGTYAVLGGGAGSITDIDYVAVATPGNCSDFGDLTIAKTASCGACDGTYGVFMGANTNGSSSNVIDHITTATPANATDFGDLTSARQYPAGAAGQ